MERQDRINAAYGAAVGAIMQAMPDVEPDMAARFIAADMPRAGDDAMAHAGLLMDAVDHERDVSAAALYLTACFAYGGSRAGDGFDRLTEYRRLGFTVFRAVAAALPRPVRAPIDEIPDLMRKVRMVRHNPLAPHPDLMADQAPAPKPTKPRKG